MSYEPCKGTKRFITNSMRKIVRSYESVDGKSHEFVNCPHCTKELRCVGINYVPRHKFLPAA